MTLTPLILFTPVLMLCCCSIGVIGGGYFCKERGFNREVQDFVLKMVPCTRRLWQLTKVITEAFYPQDMLYNVLL